MKICTRAHRDQRLAAAALAVGVLLGVNAWARADELVIGGTTPGDVRIMGIEGDLLLYETSTGESRQVLLAAVEKLRLSQHPALGEAEDLAGDGHHAQAAERYGQALEQMGETHALAIWVRAKRIAALEQAGDVEAAVSAFLDLVREDQGPLTLAARPRDLPDDAAARDRLRQTVHQRFTRTADAAARQPLAQLLNELDADLGEQAAQAADDAAPDQVESLRAALRGRPAPTAEDAPSAADSAPADTVDRLIAQGDFEQALAAVDRAIERGSGMLARRLHQRGRILHELGRHRDAALFFMRVVIHYPTTQNPYYVPSLIDSGRSFVALDQPQHARRLWQEARQATDDEATLEQIDQLLGSLP